MSFDGILLVAFVVSGALSLLFAVLRQDADENKRKIIGFFAEICMFSGAIFFFRLFYRYFPNVSPDSLFLVLTLLAAAFYLYFVLSRREQTEERIKNRKLARDIMLCLIFIFSLRGFFYDYFYIPSKSMLPTLTIGDLVLTDKKAYGYRIPVLGTALSEGREPARGEIVVFRKPGDDIYYIKRIAALPGDTLHYSADKRLFINGEVLARRALAGDYAGIPRFQEQKPDGWHDILVEDSPQYLSLSPSVDACEVTRTADGDTLTCTIPPGQYFVLGDNRDHSNDSRYWGFVPEDMIVGPAQVILFNFKTFDRFLSSLGLLSE